MISLAKKNNTKGELEVDSFEKGFMRTAAYCVFLRGNAVFCLLKSLNPAAF